MSSAKTLVVSFVGMKAQEVGVKSKLNVILESDNQMLDEVMVVALSQVYKQPLLLELQGQVPASVFVVLALSPVAKSH